jgi:hypothetical protein
MPHHLKFLHLPAAGCSWAPPIAQIVKIVAKSITESRRHKWRLRGDMPNFPWPRRIFGSLAGTFASPSMVLAVAVLAAAAPAYADDVTGSYEVKFEQISTNCEHPVTYPQHGTLKVAVKGNDVQVDIDRTPLMVGKSTKTKKLSAKSPRPGHTPIAGMDGVFSVAGRITEEGMLSLVMIGEYQTAGKPLCTQSWNLSGLRAASDKPKK